jgi:hypothetical protein
MVSFILIQGLQRFTVSGTAAPTMQPNDKLSCENKWWLLPLYLNNLFKVGFDSVSLYMFVAMLEWRKMTKPTGLLERLLFLMVQQWTKLMFCMPSVRREGCKESDLSTMARFRHGQAWLVISKQLSSLHTGHIYKWSNILTITFKNVWQLIVSDLIRFNTGQSDLSILDGSSRRHSR